MISKFIPEIKTVDKFNDITLNLYTLTTNYYSNLKISILLNDTTPYEDGVLFEDPISIYQNMKEVIKVISNFEILSDVKKFIGTLYGNNLCRILFKNENSENFENLQKICREEEIFRSDPTTIWTSFIQNSRQMFLSFSNSDRQVDTIGNIYSSVKYEILDLINIIFINNFFSEIKDNIGIQLNKNTLNDLFYFSLGIFICMIVTEIVNSIVIQQKVIKKLDLCADNFVIIRKMLII